AFLDYGNEAMRPLVLRDIADRLGIHESTVSRATANKYMLTPRGLYELKYFFSSHVQTAQGGTCSATAIQAMIKRLVAQEPADRPLSDSTLAQRLRQDGIQVARRTVAKYREALGIPPSHERKAVA
ncbi:MAG: RNA polymerase factor sigma-54, partial [Nevskiales bacterium]|nr:RNA polymerase factor sigma-54 [Nevskiales bacterium]